MDSIEFSTSCGYYGHEPGADLDIKVKDQVIEFVGKLNNPSYVENNLIEQVLILEYGFILDELKNKEWKFENIPMKDIIPAAGMRHVVKNIIDSYVEDSSSERGPYKLSCVCQKIGDKYRLIDGYHRYSVAKQLNNKNIITVYCE